MPRRLRLTKKQREDLLIQIEEAWHDTRSDWSEWLDNLPKWRKAYRGIVPKKTEPWIGCSNLSIPITALATERLHSTLMGVIDQPHGLIEVLPTESSDVSRARSMKLFANWAFFQEMMLHETLDKMAHKTCMYGRSIGVELWRREMRRIRECFPVRLDEIAGKKRADIVAVYHFRDNLVSAYRNGERSALVRYMDRGTEREGRITLLEDEERLDPRDDELEYELEHTAVTRDCPVLELPAPDEYLISADGADPYDSEYDFYSIWMTLSQIQARKRSGEYEIDDELMDKLIRDRKGGDTADEEGLAAQSSTYDASVSTVQVESAKRRGRFHIMKVFMPFDADLDDQLEECVFTLLWDNNGKPRYLNGAYLESITPTRERPKIVSDFEYMDDIPTAIGVPEKLSAIQAEVNVLHNQRVDANAIRNNPFFLYRAGSSLTPSTLRLRPGAGVPVDDPHSVWMPNFPNDSFSDLQTQEQLLGLAERLVPHGDLVYGRGSGGNRTAGGMAMLVQQSQQVWDKYVKRFGGCIGRIAKTSMQLYGANMPAWKEFRVAGTNELVKMDRESLREGYDYIVRASMLVANKEIQRAYAMQRYQMFAGNPLMQSEERQYALMEDTLLYQEHPDMRRVIGPEPDSSRHPHLRPEQEHALFAQGIAWEPHQDEDLEGHLEAHMTFLATQGHLLDPQGRQMLAQHMQHTQQFLGNKQRQQQQAMMGVAPDGATASGGGQEFGPVGGANGLMNSVQQQPGAMIDASQAGMM